MGLANLLTCMSKFLCFTCMTPNFLVFLRGNIERHVGPSQSTIVSFHDLLK